MPDSAKFSVPLSSLNHCLTSLWQIHRNYGFTVLCNYGFTILRQKLIACQTISWKANKNYFCINNSLKPLTKKVKNAVGGYQKYAKTLYTYSAIEVRPALKKNLRSSISPNVDSITYFNLKVYKLSEHVLYACLFNRGML